MTENQFELRLSGEGVNPASMPIGDLADLLVSVEQLVKATIEHSNPGVDASNVVIGLTEVATGSARLVFASLAISVQLALTTVVSAITARQYSDLGPRAIAGLRDLDRYAKQQHTDIEFIGSGEQAMRALIPSEESISLPQLDVVEGMTTVYGYLQRVGGVRPRAWLRTVNGDSVSCLLTERLARQIANRLYETVGLRGLAEWDAKTHELMTFKAESLMPYEEATTDAALDDVREAIAGQWVIEGNLLDQLRNVRSGEDSEA